MRFVVVVVVVVVVEIVSAPLKAKTIPKLHYLKKSIWLQLFMN